MDKFISTKELCEKYSINRMALMRWRNKGLPYTQLTPKIIIYNTKEVETWINENVK